MENQVYRVISWAAVVMAVGCASTPSSSSRSSEPSVPPPAAGDSRAALAGSWAGQVEIPGQALGIELAFGADGTGTIDIPAQGVTGMVLSRITVSGTAVTFELAKLGVTFSGTLHGPTIGGTMTQAGQSVPFSIARRTTAEAYTPPQLPAATADAAAMLVGAWHGAVEHPGGDLALAADLVTAGGEIAGTAALGRGCAPPRPVARLEFAAPRVHFEIAAAAAPPSYFDGELAGSKITGVMHQAGAAHRFTLVRDAHRAAAAPYREIEVAIASSGDTTLAGTLTVPEAHGAVPAVVLITGSGPQDRDECVFGVRPFRQLADHLARNGIASLRYDDRGTARSTGNFAAATAADFADDAEAAVRFLGGRAEVDPHRIGMLGHSEGGLIAPMVAARTRAVAFIVLWAGPGLGMPAVMLRQTEDLLHAEGTPPAQIAREVALEREAIHALGGAHSAPELARNLRAAVEQTLSPGELREFGDVGGWVDAKVKELWTPWLRWYLEYDPAATLAKVRCPVLAVNGGMDMQVAASPNLDAIRRALTAAGNANIEIVELPGLNHLFQPTHTGAASEYPKNPPVLDAAVLDVTTRWIGKSTGGPGK